MGRAVGISSRRGEAAQGLEVSAGDNYFASLKDFQRDTVAYVLRRLYDDEGDTTDRFLVADEVGMGKTLVARGVIAGAIERMHAMDHVQRIDVIYICSNADIARQTSRNCGSGTATAKRSLPDSRCSPRSSRSQPRRHPTAARRSTWLRSRPARRLTRAPAAAELRNAPRSWWLLNPSLTCPADPAGIATR